jgi:hypothetical protein
LVFEEGRFEAVAPTQFPELRDDDVDQHLLERADRRQVRRELGPEGVELARILPEEERFTRPPCDSPTKSGIPPGGPLCGLLPERDAALIGEVSLLELRCRALLPVQEDVRREAAQPLRPTLRLKYCRSGAVQRCVAEDAQAGRYPAEERVERPVLGLSTVLH